LDLVGVALCGVGMFLIVFGLQQGPSAHWQPWIWAVIVAGVGFFSVFSYSQALNAGEPLIPLDIFRDRNLSLSNLGVAIIAFATTGMMLPVTFYAQAVCGLSPTRSALLIAPMAITSGVLAPFVGMIVDRSHPIPVLYEVSPCSIAAVRGDRAPAVAGVTPDAPSERAVRHWMASCSRRPGSRRWRFAQLRCQVRYI
jgi:hypothetical protein